MTAICGGGTSGPKGTTPAVVFLTGESLTAIAVETLALPQAWVAVVAYALGQTFTTNDFCATDPPAMPTLTAGDILEIISGLPTGTTDAYVKLGELVAIAAWYALCECKTTATPAPPAAPSYPTDAPTINPPGPSLSSLPCWDKSDQTNGLFGGIQDIPLGPLATNIVNGTDGHFYPQQFPGNPTFLLTGTSNNDGTNPGGRQIELEWVNTAGQTLRTDTTGDLLPGQSGQIMVTPAAGWAQMRVFADPDFNTPSYNNTVTAEMKVFCDGTTPSTPQSPCCPPDPHLEAKLNQVLSLLNSIYASLPTPINSYAEGTIHSGLTGGGTITLDAETIAVKVTITQDNPSLSISPGVPPYLWNRGYIVPIAAEAPIRDLVQLVYSPQLYELPTLTEQIGYQLAPLVTASIVELTAGP